ncbi:MAG TPA: site-2 protease family protein [Candidatus Saccharimonadales bacterium]
MLGNLSGSDLVVVLLSIIIALSLHEAMHAYVAHWLGDDTAHDLGRLTLNPLKHIDAVTTVLLPMALLLSGLPPFFIAKPVPFNPDRVKYDEFGAALVGVAGPLTNLVLAGAAALLFRANGADPNSFFDNALILFTEVNIGFFIFNMIPFPPLDGSRLLYAFAPESLQELMRQIEGFGFFGIIIFMLLIFRFIAGPIGNVESSIIQFLLG